MTTTGFQAAKQSRTASLTRVSASAFLLAYVHADTSVHRFRMALARVCQRETLGDELQAIWKGQQLSLALA
jgi:hypothetical protein